MKYYQESISVIPIRRTKPTGT